jgi:GntR family transcriptional regulator
MWFEIEYNSKTPIYIQIKNGIKEEVIKKRLKSGDRIPSIREFARKLKVNQNTVAKALKELEVEKILISAPSIGYRINLDSKELKERLIESLNLQLKSLISKYRKIGIDKEKLKSLIDNISETLKEQG